MSGEDKEPVIRLRGVVNRIGDRVINDHVDLDVYRGEVLGVVGGSGAGKSVLLRSIVGLRRPQEGSIDVFGEDVLNIEESALRALQMRWGVLFQDGALFSSQTVAENIEVPLREYTSMSQSLMNEIAAMKLSMVGLPEDTARKRPSELSGGMRKRAGLARALALDPELVFLDEPTSGLDPISTRKVEESLHQLKKLYTIIIVPHSIQQAARVADQAAFLLMGDLIEYRPGIEIFTTPSDRRTEDYVTGRFG